jgi:hypothetical protein
MKHKYVGHNDKCNMKLNRTELVCIAASLQEDKYIYEVWQQERLIKHLKETDPTNNSIPSHQRILEKWKDKVKTNNNLIKKVNSHLGLLGGDNGGDK